MKGQMKDFERYLIQQKIAPSTAKTYVAGARSFLRLTRGPISNITSNRLQLHLTKLSLIGKSSNSIKSIHYQVRAYCRFLAQQSIGVDPLIESLEPIQAWQSWDCVPTPQQMSAILQAPSKATYEGLRDHCLISLLYDCGMRLTEALDLRLSDIDLRRGLLKILRKKTATPQNFPLMKITVKILKHYLPHRLFASNWLYQDGRGKRLSTHKIYSHLMQHIASIGAAHRITPHNFRHAFASHLLFNGAEFYGVQLLLGKEVNLAHLRKDALSLHDQLESYHPRGMLGKQLI